jgi:hypothetical protein
VYSFGAALPPGNNQGFTDIGSLSAEAQTAINQVKELGITLGTSATTYSPNAPVTREQMASFLIRAMKLVTAIIYQTPDCDPPFPEDPADYVPGSTVCTGETTDVANDPFILRNSPGWVLPFEDPVIEQLFNDLRYEILIDGVQQPVVEREVILNGVHFKHFVLLVPGLTGVHEIETRQYVDNVLNITFIATVTYE